MNYQEALLKIEYICKVNKNSNWSTCIENRCEECYWNAIREALEKQNPHKPMRIEPISVQGGMWTCECGHWLVECMSWLEYTKPKYCSRCGQKIDWGEEE